MLWGHIILLMEGMCVYVCAHTPVSGVTGISFVSTMGEARINEVCKAVYPTPCHKQGDQPPSQIILHPPPLTHESLVPGSRVSEQQKAWETFSYCWDLQEIKKLKLKAVREGKGRCCPQRLMLSELLSKVTRCWGSPVYTQSLVRVPAHIISAHNLNNYLKDP